jgi:hypothetical protein
MGKSHKGTKFMGRKNKHEKPHKKSAPLRVFVPPCEIKTVPCSFYRFTSLVCCLPSKSVKKGQKKKDSSIIVENITQKQQRETPYPETVIFLMQTTM